MNNKTDYQIMNSVYSFSELSSIIELTNAEISAIDKRIRTVMNNSGELIREIEVGGTNGFAFNIIDDIIYMDSGKNIYAMDLYGNKLDIKISDEKNDQIHSRSKWHIKTASGTLYQLRNNHVYRDEGYGLELIY